MSIALTTVVIWFIVLDNYFEVLSVCWWSEIGNLMYITICLYTTCIVGCIYIIREMLLQHYQRHSKNWLCNTLHAV